MTLSLRLIVTVLTSVGLAIVAVAIVMGLISRDALVDQAEGRGRLIAGLIAAEANRSEAFLHEIDAASLLEKEAQSVAIVRLADTDRSEDLTKSLVEITADSVIDDIWLLDRSGHPIARAVNGVGIHDVRDGDLGEAGIDRRELIPLLAGNRFAVSLRSTPRDKFERTLRYVSVRLGPDRFVLVGSVEDEAGETVPAAGLAEALAEQEGIEAIWVVDDRLEVTAAAIGSARGTALPAAGRELAERALNAAVIDRASDKAAFSSIGQDALHVAAPILGRWSIATGVVVMRLPRTHLDSLLLDITILGAIAAAVAFAAGSVIAIVSARRIARPVVALTRGAEEMDRGNFEPASLDVVAGRRDELGTLVRVFQTMAREVQSREQHLEGLVRERTADLQQKNEELEKAQKRVDEELRIARSLQGAILPREIPESQSYAGSAMMTPAQELGGDFYDCFTLPDGRLGIVIADVSGKGVPAAFFMAIVRTMMRSAANEYSRPGQCMREVNDAVCEQNPHSLFVTMFYGILDPANGRFDYANAGHNPPFMVGAGGEVTELPSTSGVVVGVMPDLDYNEGSVVMVPNDTLFLYTDGISEAMNEADEEFGEERLANVLEEGSEEPIRSVIENVSNAVEAFVVDAPQSDDITCMVLRYLGEETP